MNYFPRTAVSFRWEDVLRGGLAMAIIAYLLMSIWRLKHKKTLSLHQLSIWCRVNLQILVPHKKSSHPPNNFRAKSAHTVGGAK